jgi:hypothetical protein
LAVTNGSSERTGSWVGFGVAAERLGTFATTSSKGADEQSSRKAPGSLVDPGVCFLENAVDVTPELMGSAVPRRCAQPRLNSGGKNMDLVWNLIGCLGLLGIFGLWRTTDNDGYTDDPI